jgi:hypothetical protein
MIGRDRVRGIRLSTRLGVTWAGILVLAAMAQTIVYLQTRNETVEEADASYQMIAKAIEVGQTQIGPEGWKDPKVLADYTAALGVRGLRDIKVVDESGNPVFPEPEAARTEVSSCRSSSTAGCADMSRSPTTSRTSGRSSRTTSGAGSSLFSECSRSASP